MKKFQKQTKAAFTIFLSLTFMLSCQKDETTPSNAEGKASFSFEQVDVDKEGVGKSSKGVNDAAAIIITIENEAGELIYNMESIPLYNMNGSFITKSLPLKAGSYLIMEFIVVDSNGNAIYIAPIAGSTMEHLVSDPLPIFFTIEKDLVTKLSPQVVSTHNHNPGDFGYSTFSFSVAETLDFLIGVFVFNENTDNFEMTSAGLTVKAEENAIYTGQLENITNKITINGTYNYYKLVVEKAGYEKYENTFSYEELVDYGENDPLDVTLDKETAGSDDTVTDIDGNVYQIIKIGQQEWIAENLKTTTFNDGTPIPNVTSNSQWGGLTTPAYAWHSNNIDNKDIYGALYNWYAVETGNLCPEGWRVPTDDDWYQLTDNIGNPDTGGKLKSRRQVNSPLGGEYDTDVHPRWNEHDTYYGTDDYGFSALSGGFRNEIGSFGGVGSHGFWWSSSLDSQENPVRRSLRYNANTIHLSAGSKDVGFSVRCVKK